MRKMASIRKIIDIKKIENADKICIYLVDGWQIVGQSVLNPNVKREGLVFKSEDGQFTFKIVSNEWLLEFKE